MPSLAGISEDDEPDSRREDARDRLLLSMSNALAEILRRTTSGTIADLKTVNQIAHNLEGCSKDLLDASGLGHGRPSGWCDLING